MVRATTMQSTNVHDALVKATFSQVEHAEGLLRLALPAEIVAQVDFSTLTLRPGSFVDDALKERHSDLLYSADLGGERALFYMLFEHKSSPEDLVPFALLRYMVRVWKGWLRENAGSKTIPLIAPVVLHHGEGGWTRARAFEELYSANPAVVAAPRRARGALPVRAGRYRPRGGRRASGARDERVRAAGALLLAARAGA
jgi:hypothetical protein